MKTLAIIWLAGLVLAAVGAIAFSWKRNPSGTRHALKHVSIGLGAGIALLLGVYLTITALSVLFLGLKL